MSDLQDSEEAAALRSLAVVREVVAQAARRPLEEVHAATRFESDLELDSLGMIEVFVELETALEVTMPSFEDLDLASVRTVGDLAALVDPHLPDSEP